MDISYEDHKGSIVNEVLRIVDADDFDVEDEFTAFNYLVAELFSNASLDDQIMVTDKSNDHGIDFYSVIDGSYEIFQCKFADSEKIVSSPSPLHFNKEGVEDIERAYKYILRISDIKNVSPKVKHLRAQLTENYNDITFNLCIFGDLTKSALDMFNSIKKEYEDDRIKFNLYTWKEVIYEIVKRVYISDKDINYTFNIFDTQVLKKHNYCYFLAYVKEFYDLFERYGWALFDLNVRYEQKNSPVNKEIINSLTHNKSMKIFHHLNNGILILCDNYTKSNDDSKVTINGLHIINGCQTVRSIGRAYDKIVGDDSKRSTFVESCFVQVKVIRKDSSISDMLDDIIISTNYQNEMSTRNLKSNTNEQLQIKSMFDSLKHKWFYQRKDGEFDSLRNDPRIGSRSFKVSNYLSRKGNAYRMVDNNDLAKAWASHIGLSHMISMNKKIFDDRIYTNIFKAKPTEKLWLTIQDPQGIVELDDDELFDYSGLPKAEEYLLSYLVLQFINKYTPSSSKNRENALARASKKTISKEERDAYLVTDDEYMVTNMILNSKEIFAQMYSAILGQKYGRTFSTYRKLCSYKTNKQLFENPDFKKYVQTLEPNLENILWMIYEFVKYVYKQIYIEVKADYLGAPRRKAYLGSKKFILRIKGKIDDLNNENNFKELLRGWKKNDSSFIDSLPTI
ncbi:MAG TPA: AIPR family protein [bacterium]|nr:AIPR family protein [bacterium]